MKNLFYVLIAGLIVYVWFALSPGACEEPIQYRLGNIDERFGIQEDTIVDILSQTEKVWEEPIGRNLFAYNPDARLAVNFVFDERQRRFLEAEMIEKKLSSSEEIISQTETQYSSLLSLYNQKLSLYEADVRQYEKRIDAFNDKVHMWNRRGGAPEGVYEELQREQDALEIEQNNLQKQVDELNQLAEQINVFIRAGNQLIQEHNVAVETYNDKYGEDREFNQGDYTGDAINIYQFGSVSELQLVLAHEMGHALSINHIGNPESIMYYLMGNQNLNRIALTKEDVAALKSVCGLK